MFSLLADFLTVNETATDVIVSIVLNIFSSCRIISMSISETMTQTCLTGFEIRLNACSLISLDANKNNWLNCRLIPIECYCWTACSHEYSLMSDIAVNILLPFTTTCLCETAFLQSLAWKPNADQDWTSMMIYAYVCRTYHHVWTNSAAQNENNLHTKLNPGLLIILICAVILINCCIHELSTSWVSAFGVHHLPTTCFGCPIGGSRGGGNPAMPPCGLSIGLAPPAVKDFAWAN